MNLKELKKKVSALVREDEVRQSSDLGGIAYLFSLSRENYRKLFSAVAVLVLSVACLMVSVRLLGWLFEDLASDRTLVWQYAVAFLAFEVLAVFLRYGGSIFMSYTTTSIILDVRKKLFRKLTRLPVTYFDRQPLGRTVARITNDVERVEYFFSRILADTLCSVIEIGLILVAMIATDVKMGVIIACTSFPAFIFAMAMRSPVKYWLRMHKKLDASIISKFAEFANGFEVLKSFNLEKWSQRKFEDINILNYLVHLTIMHWNSFIRPLIMFLCQLPVFFVFIICGAMVIDDALSIAVFISLLRFSERFMAPVRSLSHNIQIIQDALTSAERVRQMLQEIEEPRYKDAVEKKVWGDITFANVWMDYFRDKDVLKEISFEIKKGMKAGLVGETGAGKTSTINLIPALYNYSAGDISIDGISLRDWSKPWLRKHIGYINQDVVIFRGTLRENIVCAQKKVNDHAIYQLAERLGFGRRLAAFADGLDTLVLEHGQNLSAGERQIVAFMRMMIKEPSILILDEATANVDNDYEKLLHNALFEIMADKTCFIIAHRLSTVKKCDIILVFKGGRITERGTHDSLVTLENGHYRNMQAALM